jgi:hypothetical protein
MSIRPEQLPLHSARIETANGEWGVFVQSVTETQAGCTLYLRLTLETNVDGYGEQIRTRDLEMSVLAIELHDSDLFKNVLSQIRRWTETTDGNGFLDLTHRL